MPPFPCHRSQVWAYAALIALVICACSLLLAATASATDYTWQGGGSSTAWSNASNWLGGTAPVASEAIGSLTFPALPSFQNSENDLSGLSIGSMQVDDSNGYALTGQGFSLGSGGLSIGATESSSGTLHTETPITLDGSQTWNITGPSAGMGQRIELGGALSGESSELTVNLDDPAVFFLGQREELLGGSGPDTANDELGNITINGANTPVTGPPYASTVVLNAAKVNADDGHRLTVQGVQLDDEAATGPITAIGSSLSLSGASIGAVTANDSWLFPHGVLHLPSLSLAGGWVAPEIAVQGNIAGTDYSQITSAGAVMLGGATLEPLMVATSHNECPPPTVGQVDTLVSTTGSLSGSFSEAPNDSIITAICTGAHPHEVLSPSGERTLPERVYSYRINYNTSSSPETVTLTFLPAVPVPAGELPTITGTPTQGQTLTENHDLWNNEPTSYSEQWQRCDSAGNNCQDIAGATAQSYNLTAADVGSTLRVQETASNSEGPSTTSETSEPTAVVQAASAGGGNSRGGTTTSSGDGSTGSSTSSSSTSTTASISSAQVAALLGKELMPTGKAATIPALLRAGGLTMSFKALEAGTLSVQWYEVPSGATLATHSKAKAVLIASGQVSFTGAGIGKIKIRLSAQGKKLLRHGKTVKVEAKGVFRPRGGVAVDSVMWFVVTR